MLRRVAACPQRSRLASLARIVRTCRGRVIDIDGSTILPADDRLLLAMKGSISEFELAVLRARMLDAARSKASQASCDYRSRSATSGIANSDWF